MKHNPILASLLFSLFYIGHAQAEPTGSFAPEQLVNVVFSSKASDIAKHHTLLSNQQITQAHLNQAKRLNQPCHYLRIVANSTSDNSSQLIYQNYNLCTNQHKNELYKVTLHQKAYNDDNSKWILDDIEQVTLPIDKFNTIQLDPKNYTTAPIIYDASTSYQFLLESIKQHKSDAYLQAFLSDEYIDTLGSSKGLYNTLQQVAFVKNKMNKPYCNLHMITNSNTQHRQSQLAYELTPICGYDTGNYTQNVMLKKQSGTSGWVVNDIQMTSKSKLCSSDATEDKQENDGHHSLTKSNIERQIETDTEIATETVFEDYLESVRQGDSWNTYKKFHSQRYITKTDESTKKLTEKKHQAYQNLNRYLLTCQVFTPLSHKTDGNTHTTIYEYTDKCSKSDKKNYRRVIFTYGKNAYSGTGWKIDRITMSANNDF